MKEETKPLYELGRINRLKVLRLVSIGAYLNGGEGFDLLLPLKYISEDGLSEGDEVEVFVYHDNEGRPIATTLRPYLQLGEVAALECVGVTGAGAFVDMGIHKDLLVPYGEQNKRMEEGNRYLIYLYKDEVSGRLVGSAKLNKHVGNVIPRYKAGCTVRAIVAQITEIGWRCVVDNRHWGMIYSDDAHEDVNMSLGSVHQAYVVRLREDDKIDLSLHPVGYNKIESCAVTLRRLLRRHGGILEVGDKSDPEKIKLLCGMSKKTFKQAVGALYREKLIMLSDYQIKLKE